MAITTRSPLIEELFTPHSPLTLFEYFRLQPHCFFLDSSMDPQKLGRYSFMGADPFLLMSNRGRKITLQEHGQGTVIRGNPFDILGQILRSYRLNAGDTPVPFTGGAVGYLAYDLLHFIERVPKTALDDLKLPESYIGFYDLILAYDNLLNKTYIISTGFPEQDEMRRLKRAYQRVNELKDRLSSMPHCAEPPLLSVPAARGVLKGNFTHEDYVKAVARARQYIIDGDIFEVNISQRFETRLTIPPWELYRRLRQINPAPFGSYLGFGEVTVVGASPERFLRVQGDYVETRPIKGTVRRGKTPAEDRVRARQLFGSVKDHAENMMIVDLERNDLGRVCRYGTVKVTEMAILETFPTVFHLTSTVTGRLRHDRNRIDLLKATFPGGSITGAPKIRSMEIIDELEPTRRSVYTGNIGYFGFDGNMDINIVIRTFLIKGNRAYFQVGGAVVYDSDPESEYQETLDKGRALINALNTAEPK
ncbi:MAG: aminodeoxychorismate synthase component I [Dehalococcoidia bacterium]|nr:aminodeoxychorismate synthase component I [Dehalococcoidia bacterium]